MRHPASLSSSFLQSIRAHFPVHCYSAVVETGKIDRLDLASNAETIFLTSIQVHLSLCKDFHLIADCGSKIVSTCPGPLSLESADRKAVSSCLPIAVRYTSSKKDTTCSTPRDRSRQLSCLPHEKSAALGDKGPKTNV